MVLKLLFSNLHPRISYDRTFPNVRRYEWMKNAGKSVRSTTRVEFQKRVDRY